MSESRRPNVLVVDDDPLLCDLVRVTLELRGIEVHEAGHVIEAEQRIAAALPDAIVIDVGLPGVDGIFYCERLRESPRTRSIPVVVISGFRDAGKQALAAGAQAFLLKPFDPLELLAVLEQALGYDVLDEAPIETQPAGAVPAPMDGSELRRLIAIGRRQHELLEQSYRETVAALAAALESRDSSSQHSQRVAAMAMRLTIEFAPALIDDPSLEWGFLLHDVGKIGVPDRILHKPGPLTPNERGLLEEHTRIGAAMLGHLSLLRGEGLRVVRSHHERWDGSGYPDRLAEEAIPQGARIFAVADALDELTASRPGGPQREWAYAVSEIEARAGSDFDPSVVDALVVCEPDLREIEIAPAA